MATTEITLEDRVRNRAYWLWEQDGKPVDRSDDYWHRARVEIEAGEAKVGKKSGYRLRGRTDRRSSFAVNGESDGTVTYEVVKHDGGWAYSANGSYSETFASHEAASIAAARAATEHMVAGETDGIVYQDGQGAFHEELAQGNDRPRTTVVDRT